ncbi:hypothetical protein CEUSTIGMA_g3004.t1 [Chlamydomonas eustigma]|uniref:ethanolamine kinase n=1 Tax=Chlamydomonas eustigma TaxID=1157962 RepID=A0A250WXL6_9CHLO|nr:hypothetical protein CEUSTIGMA_g3004.t1 [Chlamydomonas eustigma]|eukprot:GAX75561.1 hypothetical protein CEUSTIGMA_g3004.t1 [Chlamydomonas eustigma]
MALPHVPRLISLSHDEVIAHEEIKLMCKQLLPSWSKENIDDISVTTISGGISNLIVKVSSSGSHDPILFKVFGEKTELLVDREQELKTLINLNALGFGAQVLGTFGNGRIEKFLKSKTLEPEEMGHVLYVPCIAHKLRKFHNIPTAGKPTLWATIFGWLDMASKLVFEDERKQAKFSNIDLIAMRHEIEVTKEACDAVMSPIVFSHNDLLSGNILVLETSSDAHSIGGLLDNMQFIDFEYAASGYRGYDIGNHFNESNSVLS